MPELEIVRMLVEKPCVGVFLAETNVARVLSSDVILT